MKQGKTFNGDLEPGHTHKKKKIDHDEPEHRL